MKIAMTILLCSFRMILLGFHPLIKKNILAFFKMIFIILHIFIKKVYKEFFNKSFK